MAREAAKGAIHMGLKMLLEGEQLTTKDKILQTKALKGPKRASNTDVMKALACSLIDNNGYGFEPFFLAKKRGALPRGAKRYYTDQPSDESTSGMRKRACIQLADGSRYHEVPRRTTDGTSSHPTVHMCNDLCKASFLCGMCLTHTDVRGTAF